MLGDHAAQDGVQHRGFPPAGSLRAVLGRAGVALAPLLGLATVAMVWEIASRIVDNEVVMPSTGEIAGALVELARTTLLEDIEASLAHLLKGYLIGVSLGLALAALTLRMRLFEALIEPLIELLRPLSAIAWIPIAILIFGISDAVPIFLIAYATVFPIYVNTVAGVRSIDPKYVAAARTLGASPRLIARDILVPAALPHVLSGARLSLGIGWMALIAAELVGADAGLGWRAVWFEQFLAMDKMMALVLTIGVLGYLIDRLLTALQARLLRWHPSTEGAA